jgi:hypothetical protein
VKADTGRLNKTLLVAHNLPNAAPNRLTLVNWSGFICILMRGRRDNEHTSYCMGPDDPRQVE